MSVSLFTSFAQPMAPIFVSLLLVLLLFLGTVTSFGSKICEYQSNCGVALHIKYPFRFKGDSTDCGIPDHELTCEHNRTVLQLPSGRYFVEAIDYEFSRIRVSDPGVVRISDPGLDKGNCSTLQEYSPNDYRPLYASFYNYLIVLLSCKSSVQHPYYVHSAPCITAKDFSDYSTEEHSYSYALIGQDLKASDIEDSCSIYKIIPSSSFVSESTNITFMDIHNALASGFYLEWPRHGSKFSVVAMILYFLVETLCYIALAIAARAVVGIIALFVFLIYKYRRRRLSAYDTIEAFLQSGSNLMPIRYSFKEIKKMTNNFKHKLGQGGYGDVYKGKSRSGHLVAVKVLNAAKGSSGQDFINEVSTIGRIYHINVVRLVGFCATASKRALVYDYMPNGSLDKFILSEDPNGMPLSWERAHEIAVGVARGIGYLHQGCNMQILHFDIKPHNVLLDENFVPKISDFGLAKLCPIHKSAVTLTAVKGTLGYMAPELIYRKIGGVSYKADVYSFGQLLLAMVGRRKANALTDHSSRVYFSAWIYEKVDRGEEEDLDLGDITEDEKDTVKKMILVALWCVQWTPADRPSMREVLEMLEGNLEDMKLPPKPLYYPPDLPAGEQSSNQDSGDSTFPLCESITLEIEQND